MEKDLNFHPASPILLVGDLAKSIDFYVTKLGFKVDWEYESIFASVSRGQANIMLSEGDQGQGKAWVYIGVGDAELLFQEYTTRGTAIRQGPTNFSWALEIQIEDPDGNVIRFGSEPKDNLPFGPWLDMNGKHWNL